MRVFIDTNVWLSNFLTRGICYDIVTYCNAEHQILTSEFVLKEIADKLRIKLKFPREDILAAQTVVRTGALVVTESALKGNLSRDRDDDHIIAAAVGGQADCLLTGDKDLLVLKKVHGIAVVPPNAFMMFEESWRKKNRAVS